MSSDISGVFVSAERLKELEKYEAECIAKEKKKKAALELLRAQEKANPEKHSKKVLANYHKNKDAINAKKREQYAAKKAAQETEKAKNQIE